MGGWGGGGHGIKQGKRINKRVGVGGGGGHSHTQRIINFGTTAVSPIPTLTYQEIVFFCLWHEK